tara:strand:+ start:1227 stop:2315 length:1089 start_codon:yes stop_codon:yes gene_type:complete
MSASRQSIITGLSVIGVLAIQRNLSYNNTKSLLYWRNIPVLSGFIFELAHYKYIDYLLSLSIVVAAADFEISQFIDFVQAVPSLRRVKNLFNKLDDIVDNNSVDQIYAYGEATLGTELSPFLLGLLDHEDKRVVDQLIADNMITRDEMISFCNVLANKLFMQTMLTNDYNLAESDTLKAEIRQQIAKENLEISGCYLALVIHFIKKDPRIKRLILSPGHQGLNYEEISLIYPTVTKAGELMQIAHDTPEFRYDLRNQPRIGKISANYFLAQLESNGCKTDFIKALPALPSRPVTVVELPERTRMVLNKVEHQFINEANKLGTSIGITCRLAWFHNKHVGFYEEKPSYYEKQKLHPPMMACKL